MQSWKILYTTHKSIKQATTKTGALKEGKLSKSKFIVIDGKDSSECLFKAKNECCFNDSQLLGMRQLTDKEKQHLSN